VTKKAVGLIATNKQMNQRKLPNTPSGQVKFSYSLDSQAKKTVQSLSKKSLVKAVNADAKIFRAHKIPKK